jgi:hypothetical protein
MSVESRPIDKDRWLRVEQWLQERPGQYPDSVQALRGLLRRRHANGLVKAGAISKCGKLVLIHEQRMLDWIASKAEAPATGG